MLSDVQEIKAPEEPIYYSVGRFLKECGYNITYNYQAANCDLRSLSPEDSINIDKPLSGPEKQIMGGTGVRSRLMIEIVRIGELTGLSGNGRWSMAVFGQNHLDEIRLLAEKLSQNFGGKTIEIQLVQIQENIHAHRAC